MWINKQILTKDEILSLLFDIRKDAGEPRIGCREVEIIVGRNYAWKFLKTLRIEGKIKRARGFCWLTEDAFEELLKAYISKRN